MEFRRVSSAIAFVLAWLFVVGCGEAPASEMGENGKITTIPLRGDDAIVALDQGGTITWEFKSNKIMTSPGNDNTFNNLELNDIRRVGLTDSVLVIQCISHNWEQGPSGYSYTYFSPLPYEKAFLFDNNKHQQQALMTQDLFGASDIKMWKIEELLSFRDEKGEWPGFFGK